MYSSVSIATVGDDSLLTPLRMLTSLELFLNANYYSKHPCFLSTFSTNRDKFQNFNSLLSMSVSFEALDSNLQGDELVKKEAIFNVENSQWAGFLCILALSSITRSNINSFILTLVIKSTDAFSLKIFIHVFLSKL